jgi:hypothetical protein
MSDDDGLLAGIDGVGPAYKPNPETNYAKPGAPIQPPAERAAPTPEPWSDDDWSEDEPEEGLTPAEQRELDRLMRGNSGLSDQYPEPALPDYQMTSADREIFDGVREIAARHKVPPEALQQMAELVLDMNQQMAGEAYADAAAAAADRQLRKEWGSAFDANLASAGRAFRHFGGPDLQAALDLPIPGSTTRLGDFAPLVRCFAQIGKMLPADALPGEFTGGSTTRAQGGMPGSPGAAKAEIARMHKQHAVGTPGYTDKAFQRKLQALYRVAYPGEAQ